MLNSQFELITSKESCVCVFADTPVAQDDKHYALSGEALVEFTPKLKLNSYLWTKCSDAGSRRFTCSGSKYG